MGISGFFASKNLHTHSRWNGISQKWESEQHFLSNFENGKFENSTFWFSRSGISKWTFIPTSALQWETYALATAVHAPIRLLDCNTYPIPVTFPNQDFGCVLTYLLVCHISKPNFDCVLMYALICVHCFQYWHFRFRLCAHITVPNIETSVYSVLSNIETSTVYSRTGTLCFPASKRRLRSFYNKVNSLCVFYIIKSNKVIEPDVCLNLSRTLVTKNYRGFTMT